MSERMSLPPSSAFSAAESILPIPPPSTEDFSYPAIAQELGESLLLLLRVGSLLARSGAAAFRVRGAMQRVAGAVGVERAEFVVAVDSITASVFDRDQFRTQTVRLPPLGVDMNLLCQIELLTRHLTPTEPEVLGKRLDALQSAPRLYPKWLTILGLGAACGAFCAAGKGDLYQIFGTFGGAAAGHSVRLFMLARQTPLIKIVVSCAFTAALVGSAIVWLVHPALIGQSYEIVGLATLSSVLFLIPGVPLVTSIVDLVHLDITAAIGRASYAAVIVAAIAVGVFAFIAVAGLFFR
jgi:uncharacterized membrane protein YjjP (DUF1212 family)